MAKITIMGDAIVVTSSKSLKALKTLEEYRPKALTLYETNEDNGKKEPVFTVKTGSQGIIGQYGATFASETHDEAKLATITLSVPAGTQDVKAYAAKLYGKAVMLLNKVEASLDDALNSVEAEKAEMLSSIEVI